MMFKKLSCFTMAVFLSFMLSLGVHADETEDNVTMHIKDYLTSYLNCTYMGTVEKEYILERTVAALPSDKQAEIYSRAELGRDTLMQMVPILAYEYDGMTMEEALSSFPKYMEFDVCYNQELHLPIERENFETGANVYTLEKITDGIYYANVGYSYSFVYTGLFDESGGVSYGHMLVWYEDGEFAVLDLMGVGSGKWEYDNYRFSEMTVSEMLEHWFDPPEPNEGGSEETGNEPTESLTGSEPTESLTGEQPEEPVDESGSSVEAKDEYSEDDESQMGKNEEAVKRDLGEGGDQSDDDKKVLLFCVAAALLIAAIAVFVVIRKKMNREER